MIFLFGLAVAGWAWALWATVVAETRRRLHENLRLQVEDADRKALRCEQQRDTLAGYLARLGYYVSQDFDYISQTYSTPAPPVPVKTGDVERLIH